MQFPHVLFQVKVSAETLTADVASVGLLIVVCVHVEGKVVDLMERLAADAALELLLRAVGQLVVLVVTFLMEPFAAELAHVRFVALVYAHVRVQCGAAVERFPAGAALVRFLGRVDDFVPAERASLAETLSADLADERPCTSVNRHVAGKVIVSVENFPTLRTSECLLRFPKKLLRFGIFITTRNRAVWGR